jgi:hypothetical protein
MNDFTSDAENLKLYFWITVLGVNVVALTTFGVSSILIIPLSIAFLFLRPWQYAISKAMVVNKQLEVTKRNWLLGSKHHTFDLLRIDFTYRTRPIEYTKPGFFNTTNTGNVLMVFHDEHLLFDLTPGEGMWTNTSIRQFARHLKDHQVKQTFEKYGTDDVSNY